MSPYTANTQVRLNSIMACLIAAVATVDMLANSLKVVSLSSISATTKSLVKLMETTKRNKNECTHLLEQTLVILHAIIALSVQSNTPTTLSPSMLNHVGNFTLTLHKIHTFVEAQQEGSRFKKLLHLSETSILLKDCKSGLQKAIDVFKVNTADLLKDMSEIQMHAVKRHQEVLDLIASLAETDSEASSSSSGVFSSSYNSSTSISMLPSMPKIFHGRESELSDILKLFTQEAPRIAILGAGGMGKTSLARAMLHHPNITYKYGDSRIFVACDVAATMEELIILIANYLGLKLGSKPTRQIVNHFASGPPTLLIMDNLETAWESTGSRKDIEEFLSLLTDIQQLALIITMRGAERPAQVRWTRPFLQPLQPLTYDAAQKTFIDIAGEMHDGNDIDKILCLTDHMPLAIHLLAHLVDSEGCATVLSRWNTERTSLISDGYDQRSNLDMSIALSLSSPRLASVSGTKDLLSLLSILPDGLSDIELKQSNFPIDNIFQCRVTLLRMSMAYVTGQKKLKVLIPIQEHMQKHHPTQLHIVEPLFQHYWELLKYNANMLEIVPKITVNLANIQNLILFRIQQEHLDHSQTIHCAIKFNDYNGHAGNRIMMPLMDQIPSALEPIDHRLAVLFIAEFFFNRHQKSSPRVEALIEQSLGHLIHFHDPHVKCLFYNVVADYYYMNNNVSLALEFYARSLSLSVSEGRPNEQLQALQGLTRIKWFLGDFPAGQVLACKLQKVAQLNGDLLHEAQGLRFEAMCLGELGHYPNAFAQCERAQSLLALCGLSGGFTVQAVLNTLAEIHKIKSEYIQARDINTRILQCAVEQESFFDTVISLLNIAEIDILLDAPRQNVQKNIDSARSMMQKVGYSRGFTICDATQAHLYLRERNLTAAKQILEDTLKLALGKSSEMITYCLERLGDMQQWGSIYWTYIWPTLFLVYVWKTKNKVAIYKALQFLGNIFLFDGDQNTALSLFTIALDGFTYMDIHRSRAECMLHLGNIAKMSGDFEKAEEFWKLARSLFERASQLKKVALIDERLLSI